MSIAHTKLLRRTLSTLGAGVLLAASHPALSQGTVTLSTGQSCQYSQMTVQPNGSISVTCVTSTPTTATFSVSAPASLAVSTTSSFSVSRSGGPVDSLNVAYSVTGNSCTNIQGSLSFAQNGPAQAVTLTTNATQGSCVVSITAPSGHQAAPSSATITVGSSTPPPDPGVPGCPAPQADYKLVNLGWSSAPSELRMPSGQIASFPIPAPRTTKSSVRLSQGQVAVSPGGYSEFSVSRCPGVIDTAGGSCYKKVQAGNYTNAPDAYTKPVGSWDTQAEFDSRLSCWAPATEGQWYVNVRWTYTTNNCPYGCGYSLQWYEGSY